MPLEVMELTYTEWFHELRFGGDPLRIGRDPTPNSANPDAGQEAHPSVIEKVKLVATETVQSFILDMWLARQTPEKVMPILQKVVEGAKEEFADAVANGGGIYAVGYCFGGKYVLRLGSELPDTVTKGQAQKDEEQGVVKAKPLIKAGALAHGMSSCSVLVFVANSE